MFGPLPGQRHDAFMPNVSGLMGKLANFRRPDDEPYVIYGDPAYELSRNILAPFHGTNLNTQ